MPEAEHVGIDAGRRALARGAWAAATLDRGAVQYATQRYAMRRNASWRSARTSNTSPYCAT
jgi:hypothetical protein